MANYEKPVILSDNDVAEGVYTASGGAAGDCWTGSVSSVQDWNGSHNVFEVRCVHSSAVEHITTLLQVTLTFSNTLSDAYSEFPCSFSGNTVTVSRELLADGYHSGDVATFKVWAKAADEAATKALSASVTGLFCDKAINVQGGGANGT